MTTIAPIAKAPEREQATARRDRIEGRSGEEAAFSRAQWGILCAITAVALLLRLWRIGEWSVWIDEAHTWRDVTMPLERFWQSARAWYPTSYLLLRSLLEGGYLPGDSEGALRLPFAWIGAITIPALAWYGRSLVGRRAALLAAAFLAVHPWHLWWSQNARGYAPAILLAVIACGEFWSGRQSGSRLRVVFAWALAVAAASCHPSGTMLLAVFACAHILGAPRAISLRFRVGCVVATALVVMFHPLLELLPPLRNFTEAKAHAEPSLMHLAQTTAWHFRVPLLVLAAVGAWIGMQSWTKMRTLFLALWGALPLALLAMVSMGFVKVTARYAVISLPALTLLAGSAAIALGDAAVSFVRRVREGRVATTWLPRTLMALVLGLDLVGGSYLYFTAMRGERAPWNDAAQLMQSRAGSKPVSVHTTHEPILQYVLHRDHWRLGADVPGAGEVRSIERHDVLFAGGGEGYVRAVLDRSKGLGMSASFAVVLPELREKDVDGSLLAALHARCELIAVLPFWVGPKDETIYVFSAR